jgi:hypothetical protein
MSRIKRSTLMSVTARLARSPTLSTRYARRGSETAGTRRLGTGLGAPAPRTMPPSIYRAKRGQPAKPAAVSPASGMTQTANPAAATAVASFARTPVRRAAAGAWPASPQPRFRVRRWPMFALDPTVGARWASPAVRASLPSTALHAVPSREQHDECRTDPLHGRPYGPCLRAGCTVGCRTSRRSLATASERCGASPAAVATLIRMRVGH